jgi:hypothetical protein
MATIPTRAIMGAGIHHGLKVTLIIQIIRETRSCRLGCVRLSALVRSSRSVSDGSIVAMKSLGNSGMNL